MSNKIPTKLKMIYLITFLGELYLIIPIWIFFYQRVLTFEQIALITSIQQLTAVLFELPTGAFADLFGKKKTLIICYFLYSISLLFMPFGFAFIYFIILEIIKGIAKAMYSGTFEAFVYDTLKDQNKEKEYPKITANMTTISWVALIIAGVLGGFMYEIWYGLPYIVLGIIYVIITIIMIFFTTEPNTDTIKYSLKSYISQNTKGFKELFASFKTSTIVLILAIVTFGYYVASELLGISQAKEYGMNGIQVGFLFSIGYLFSAVASQFFPKLLKKFGNKILFTVSTTMLILSFLLAKFVSPVLGAMLIIMRISSSTTFSNLRTVKVNSLVSSKNRATALSSFSLMYVSAYIITAYFAGKYIEAKSPNEFAFLIGIIVTIMAGFLGFISIFGRSIRTNSKEV
ncbi:MFS transporter [Candidatus Dojkabacteria bacterium]|nr:MFS transporter [Candidatus Dojkabacteria bacterium]